MQMEQRKKEEELRMSKQHHVCLYKDKALDDEGECNLLLEDIRGGLPQNEGPPSHICDTWDTVSPSSQEERAWEVVMSGNV